MPLLNRPFLAHQLALLREHGVVDAILACSYRVDDVRDALGEAEHLGVRLRYVVEHEPLGTGGGIANASDLASGTVFVLNGDVLTDADLGAMREFHEARGSRATIFVTRVDDPRAYGVVETAADGRIVAFREKPAAGEAVAGDHINAGIYLLDAALLARVPRDRPVSIEREIFPALIAEGVPCYAWASPAYWRDIGTPAAYRAAQMDLLAGRARLLLPPPGELRDGSWIGGGAALAPGARIVAPSAVGAGVRLGAGCRIGPSAVLGDGATIGPHACVEGAVLWERVEVGPGAILRDCVVAAGARIGAHARLGADVVLEAGAVVPERATLSRDGAR